jgi:hypothetical protein
MKPGSFYTIYGNVTTTLLYNCYIIIKTLKKDLNEVSENGKMLPELSAIRPGSGSKLLLREKKLYIYSLSSMYTVLAKTGEGEILNLSLPCL